MTEQKWPQRIWIVRHGQSAGNVARDAAEANNLPFIDIATRDMDTPLSPLGEQQAEALGFWFRDLPKEEQPTALFCSPYVRARMTAQLVLKTAAIDTAALFADERLREKEFGILDRLTRFGIQQKYPELSEQREHVGKFYFRPPGGESWCDVILRLRNVIDTLTREHRCENVLIIAHQVIVNCFRYLLERMDEQTILEIDRKGDIPNCAVTSYEFDPTVGKEGKLKVQLINFIAPLKDAGSPITTAQDVPLAPKS